MVQNAPVQTSRSTLTTEPAPLADNGQSDIDLEHIMHHGDATIARLRAAHKPRIFIISGPSGVGKDTVIEQLQVKYPDARYVVTATTRPMRRGEVDGLHYFFLDEQTFLRRIEEKDFIENALVYGNHYGVPRSPIVQGLNAGQDVIIKVDVKGANTLRQRIANTISIFLAPESMDELLERLRARKTDDHDVLMKRFRTAAQELERANEFDYVVFNEAGKLDEALSQICNILDAEQRRVCQPDIEIP